MEAPCGSKSLNNEKPISDSGYGSNKSNCQSQRSSGSSKSQHSSSLSSEGRGYADSNPTTSNPLDEEEIFQSQEPTKMSQPKVRCASGKDQKRGNGKNNGTGHEEKHILPTIFDQDDPFAMGQNGVNANETKVLQMAAITRALSCMKHFSRLSTDGKSEEAPPTNSMEYKWQEYFEEHLKEETGASIQEDGFATAVSMEDGVVVHLSPNITKVLGFPKDMWIGRSFIDFVHPKDRIAFASHITCGLSFPIGEDNSGTHGKSKAVNSEPFFCRMREYRGLRSTGFGVVDKAVVYFPFKLTMRLKEIDLRECSSTSQEDKENGNRSSSENPHVVPVVHLVILATKIKSCFQTSEEVPTNPVKFITRHSASCNFGHFDTEGISYLGHLPQDLIGNSILDYYHPEDMGLLKGIYEGVMLQQGKPFRSKPYRFKAFNGTYVLMETDWSCFINPWSWKLEFVIGQHRVLQGPLNPNVFMQPREEDILKVSEEVANECKAIQDEIKNLLNETVSRRLTDPMRHQSTRRKKNLATLMESLLEPIPNAVPSFKSGSQCSGTFSLLLQEKDTVMLGEISPYHEDNSTSVESSETPPSYSQLNYRENIERFFQSHPKTTRSAESGEKMEMAPSSTDEESKISACPDYSSGSNNGHWSYGSNESEDCGGNNEACLTEDLLLRHNDKMEKFMTHRHHSHKRHHRIKSKPVLGVSGNTKAVVQQQQAIKRATNSSWCGESGKAIKLPHLESGGPATPPVPPSHSARPTTIALWPPFSISYTPGILTTTYTLPGISNIPGLTESVPLPSTLGAPTVMSSSLIPRSPLPVTSTQRTFLQPVKCPLSPPIVHLLRPSSHPIYNGLEYPGQKEPSVLLQPFLKSPNPALLRMPHQAVGMYQSVQSHLHAQVLPRCHQAPNFAKEMGILFQHPGGPPDASSSKAEYAHLGAEEKLQRHFSDEAVQASTTQHELRKPNPTKSNKTKINREQEKPAERFSNSECSRDLEDSCSSSMLSLLKTDTTDESISSHEKSLRKAENDFWGKLGEPVEELREDNLRRNQNGMGMLDESKYFMIHVEERELSSEFIFRFQLPVEDSSEVLSKNFDALKLFGQQSAGVNEQLDQLYAKFKRENKYPHALLEDERTTSSGNESTASETTLQRNTELSSEGEGKWKRRKYNHGRIISMHEENVAFPPPVPV